MLRIGVISDTHGLLRPEARAFLAGSDHILHGGDICGPEVLEALRTLAPVTAVRGNNDQGAWARTLPEHVTVRFGEVLVHVVHDLKSLAIDPVRDGVRVVVCGHSHQPRIATRDGVLYVNPGSAGRRRFKLPVTVAQLLVEGDEVTARLQELAIP